MELLITETKLWWVNFYTVIFCPYLLFGHVLFRSYSRNKYGNVTAVVKIPIAPHCKTNKLIFVHINLLPYLINYFIKTPTMLNRACKCRVANVKNGNTVSSCETPGINKTRRFEAELQHSQYSFPWKQTTHRTSRNIFFWFYVKTRCAAQITYPQIRVNAM